MNMFVLCVCVCVSAGRSHCPSSPPVVGVRRRLEHPPRSSTVNNNLSRKLDPVSADLSRIQFLSTVICSGGR